MPEPDRNVQWQHRDRERASERMGEISLVIDKNGWFDLFGSVEWSAAYRSKIIIIALIALSQHRADAFTISCPHAQMLWMSVCLVLAVWSLISFHSRFEFLSSPFFRFHRTFRVHRVFISAGWHSYCVCCVAVQEHRIQSVLWHCARTHSMFNSILCSVSTSNELSHISELPVLFFSCVIAQSLYSL